MELTGLGLNTQQGNGTEAAASKLAENFDDFLTLLTEQLKNQDPLSPLDSNQFIAQLVQFTEVEQALSSNQKLDQLIGLQSSNQAVSALGMIGHTVEAAGDALIRGDAPVSWRYSVPEGVSSVGLTVLDSTDNVVFSTAGQTAAGKHSFTWDGGDNSGIATPAGTYRLIVSALDGENLPLSSTTMITGTVTGVESTDDGLAVSLGGIAVPFDKILSISAPDELDPPA